MSGDQFDGPKRGRIGDDGSLGGGIRAHHGVAGFAGELHTAEGDGETVHAVGDVSFGAVGLEDVPGEVGLLVLEPLYSVGRCTRSLESVSNTKQRDHETVSAEWNASAIRAASARRPGTRNLTSIKP